MRSIKTLEERETGSVALDTDNTVRGIEETENGRKPRILFVDDEPNFLAGIRLMLRKQRHEWDIYFAGGVDEAIAKMADLEYDAVVSDVSMPVKTGLDLITEMRTREETQYIPIVILTGNAESDLKREALDRGATDLLNKPVSSEDLLARLRSVLKLKSYQDQLANQNQILEQRVWERTRQLESSRRDIVWRLAKAGEFRDEETGNHVVRVACCSHALATAANLDEEKRRLVFITSPLHDIGKIGIPDSILLKRGKLSEAERQIIETHCDIGASILQEDPKGMQAFLEYYLDEAHFLKRANEDELKQVAISIVMCHHEKWDGSGYPQGLKGDAIPISGRIVAISDVYDALRSERPYKPAYSEEKTLDIMRKGKGSHFDPELFEAFESVVEEFAWIHSKYSG